jgi:rod shape determining protein RodA
LALLAYGLAMVHSATSSNQPLSPTGIPVVRQAIYAAIGLALLFILALVDYRWLLNLAPALYCFGVALLVLVLVLGRLSYGAQRWIQLWIVPIQPSEIAKVALAIMLAKYLADRVEDFHSWRPVLGSAALSAVPVALTFVQPDLGTTIIFVSIWLMMLVMAGLRVRQAAIMGAVGILALPVLWLLMHDYMRVRFLIFLNPNLDPLDAGYNIRQALISVGSGGLFGRGFMEGTQSQLHFLRVQYSDFIFSVLAEELGFVGAAVLCLLLILFLMRVLHIAAIAADGFGRLMAIGLFAKVLTQVVMNVGMNVGLLPVAGVTLPFLSYGGSSLIATLAGIGILQSVAMRRQRLSFE